MQSPLFARTGLRVISRNGLQRIVKHTTAPDDATLSAFFGGPEDLFVSLALEEKGNVALISAPEARVLVSVHPVEDPEGFLPGQAGIASETAKQRALFALKVNVALTGEGQQSRDIALCRGPRPA